MSQMEVNHSFVDAMYDDRVRHYSVSTSRMYMVYTATARTPHNLHEIHQSA